MGKAGRGTEATEIEAWQRKKMLIEQKESSRQILNYWLNKEISFILTFY